MTYFSIEITYDGREFGEVRLHRIKNLTPEKFKQFRDEIFLIGLYIPNKERPTEGVIVPPARLRSIDVFIQSKKFE